MAFPQVEGTATSVEASATTSHTVSLPASIVSGEVLVVWFSVEHSSDSTVAWPGGWTELDETFNVEFEGAVAYRIATGSEGSTITVTTGQSQKSGHIAYRISGNTSNAPEIDVSNAFANPDPPSNTPSWGAKDTLWLAAYVSSQKKYSISPAGYSNTVISPNWGTDGENAVAGLEANTTADNPSTFST